MPTPITKPSPADGKVLDGSSSPKVHWILSTSIPCVLGSIIAALNGCTRIIDGIAVVGMIAAISFGGFYLFPRSGGTSPQSAPARRMNASSIIFFGVAIILPCLAEFDPPSVPSILPVIPEAMAIVCGSWCLVAMAATRPLDVSPLQE